jgi:hypothetical protein
MIPATGLTFNCERDIVAHDPHASAGLDRNPILGELPRAVSACNSMIFW